MSRHGVCTAGVAPALGLGSGAYRDHGADRTSASTSASPTFLDNDPICEVIPTRLLNEEPGFRPTKYTYWHSPGVGIMTPSSTIPASQRGRPTVRTARKPETSLAENDLAQLTETKGEGIVMRRRTRPTAKGLIVAVACVALVVGLVGLGFGLISRMNGSTSDSVDEALAAIGDDPQAALEYLTPEGDGSVDGDGVWVPGQTTTDRWTMLTSRDWGKHAPGLDALTAVTGAASSFRNRAPSETDPDVPTTADARATYACGRAMSYFGGEGFTKKDFTDTMKRNLAVVAANSSQDVSTAAINGALGAGATSAGLAATDIASLIYRFGDNQDAMTTLATGLGQYHHNKLEETMNDPDASKGSLRNTYQRVAASSSYLQTLSEFRFADDKKKDSEEQTTTVDTSLSVLNAVSTAGLTALTDEAAAPMLAFTTGSTIAKSLVSSQVTDALGTPTGDPYTGLRAQSYAAGLNYGLFSTDSDKGGQRAIDTARSHSWYHEDENGNPAIDTAALTGDQASDAVTWREDEVRNEDDLGVLNDLDTSITAGKTDGEKSAKSNNGPRRK